MDSIHKSYSSILKKIGKNKYKLTIEDHNVYKNFWKNNIKSLDVIEKDYGDKMKVIFKANEIITFKELLKIKKNKLGYKQSETLFIYFKEVMESLEKDNCSNMLLNLNEIFVINPIQAVPTYFYMDTKYFLPIENENIEVSIPFMKNNYFLSPELRKIKDIPSIINKNSIYYSIGVLISYSINKSFFKASKYEYDTENIINNLDSIFETKLYYGVIRCLKNNPQDRFLLYI